MPHFPHWTVLHCFEEILHSSSLVFKTIWIVPIMDCYILFILLWRLNRHVVLTIGSNYERLFKIMFHQTHFTSKSSSCFLTISPTFWNVPNQNAELSSLVSFSAPLTKHNTNISRSHLVLPPSDFAVCWQAARARARGRERHLLIVSHSQTASPPPPRWDGRFEGRWWLFPHWIM